MEPAIRTLSLADDGYPGLLREIPGPAEQLFVRGTLPKADAAHIAIVGTRKATAEGRTFARTLARELAGRGAVVVSGLALGIDAAAHEGAIEGRGTTVAVLANGLDTIYPASHESLGRRILETGGCLVSEYPAGTPALPHRFLERNRIISGLSSAVVIIEAPSRSGSLATARHAALQGREVFVVPGPARHPNFAGSHMLIRNGARLVTSADEVLEDLGLEIAAPASETTAPISPTARTILELISKAKRALGLDEIAEAANIEPAAASEALTMLLLDGFIDEKRGHFIVRGTK